MARVNGKAPPQIIVPRRHRADHKIIDYNEIEIDESYEGEENVASVEMWISDRLGKRLVKEYPGVDWRVKVDVRERVVFIQGPDVSNTHAYVLKLEKRTLDDLENQMKRVGGEILERGRIRRDGKVDQDDIESRERTLREDLKDVDNG